MSQVLLDVADDLGEFNADFVGRGWSDGLPLVPPTAELVEAMLAASPIGRDESVGVMEPNGCEATAELIAINAVMAGCLPEYFPVLLAAVEVVIEPSYNLAGVQATTNGAAPFAVVNGPLARNLGFNGAGNCLGPGWRANATVGRALRLCLINIGGGSPAVRDMATLGQPAKYGLLIRENEEESPWAPYHTEQGFTSDQDAVSVFTITGTQSIFDGCSKTADELLKTIVSSTATVGMHNMQMGGGPVLLLCVDHARLFADAGYSRRQTRELLWETCTMAIEKFPADVFKYMVQRKRPRELWDKDPSEHIPFADSPDDIKIFVAGGPGPHSMLMPRSSIGVRGSITKAIRRP
jgi:hypothetical protein